MSAVTPVHTAPITLGDLRNVAHAFDAAYDVTAAAMVQRLEDAAHALDQAFSAFDNEKAVHEQHVEQLRQQVRDLTLVVVALKQARMDEEAKLRALAPSTPVTVGEAL